MSQKFEVTLVGNDQFGSLADGAADKVGVLRGEAEKLGLSLHKATGKEAQGGLGAMGEGFSSLAKSAKDNVQNIGDMIPPLKNFGELSGKYFGSLGRLGAIAGTSYALTSMAGGLHDAAKEAYDLDVAAKSLGISVEKLSTMTGAFRLLGIDEESSTQSIQNLDRLFNDVIKGKNNDVLSQLTAMGLNISDIPTRKDEYGNEFVIIDELLPVLDKLYDSISDAQTKSEFSRITGLDANMQRMFMGDVAVQKLYQRAQELGYVRTEALNESLKSLNSTVSDTSAAIGGWFQRTKDDAMGWLLSDGSVQDGLKGVGDAFSIGDRASWMSAFGINRGDDSEKMRTIKDDPEYHSFRRTLGMFDGLMLTNEVLSDGMWDKFMDFKKQSNPSYQDPFEQYKSLMSVENNSESKIKAFLNTLAMAEGTFGKGDDGYNILYGGGSFGNYEGHPRYRQQFRQTDGAINYTTAAGRYQITAPTYDEFAPQLGITDFSKQSQDRIAWAIIEKMGAVNDVLNDNWTAAYDKLGGRWASLPSSPHPQNTHSWNTMSRYEEKARQAIAQEPIKLEVRLTNTDTGHSQTINTQTGGTVTTAMNF